MEGKEKRVEEKEEEKRGMGKSGFGKSPFCFCLTVSLRLPFFLAPTTPPHHNTRSHSPTHYTTLHICTPSHANRAVCWCCCEHMAPFSRTVMTSFFFFAIRGFLLPNSFFYYQPKIFCNLQLEEKSLFCN